MKKNQTIKRLPPIWVMASVILMASAASGQYQITSSTIDGGGGQSSGGSFTLTATIGQPDAAWSSGGKYELLGGFWPGGPLCFVDFESYARFAELWLVTGSDLPADLDGSGFVDFGDLKEFADLWLTCCPVDWPLK